MKEYRFDLREILKLLYVFMVLLMPFQVIVSTSIYTTVTPDEISYKYRDFYFSVLALPGVLYACYNSYKKTIDTHFEKIIILIFLKDIILRLFIGETDIIDYNYSLLIVLITAWSLCYIVCSDSDSIDELEKFIDLYFIVTFLSLLLRMLLGFDLDGRYGALGLSVGGSGFLAGIYVLFCVYYKEKGIRTNILCLLALFMLLVSGQRTSMIVTAFLSIFPSIISLLTIKHRYSGIRVFSFYLTMFSFVGIFVILFGLLLSMGYKIPGYEVFNRMLDSLFMSNNLSDDSLSGRLMSIEAALDILIENPIGITNNFYDLQYRMGLLGYPTFPHCTLLACSLLWSPMITAICFVTLLICSYKLARLKSKLYYILVYMIIMSIIWGGVFLDYPILFIELFFVAMAYMDIRRINSLNKRS